VQQPWAWAIAHAGKDIENRTQLWSYRGPLAIHAGNRMSPRGFDDPRIRAAMGTEPPELLTGAILAVCDLVDVHFEVLGCCQPWGEQSYREPDGRVRTRITHMVLTDVRPLATPIPASGRLGLWSPDEDLLAELQDSG